MKIIKTIFLLSFIILASGIGVRADNLGVEWQDSTRVRLVFTLNEGKGLGSDYSVWAMPMLTNGRGDTLRLEPAVFRGKRNMRYTDRARYFGDAPQASDKEVAAGQPVEYAVVVDRTDAPWLWNGRIDLDAARESEGCCEVESMPAAHIGHFAYVPPFSPVLALVPDNTGKAGELQKNNPVLLHISQYKPYDGSRMEGALYVHFPLDKYVLLHDFRNNASTLDRIVYITRAIMADTTSSVKIIQIVGLASVEGPQRHNVELAGNRVKALKAYVQNKVNAPDSLFEIVNGGEAWAELRYSIEESKSPWRDRLLNIIDTEKNADSRERLIKRLDGGRAYQWLKDSVLGDQRNSGYLRIYYDYVPDKEARTINAATELLRQGKHEEALKMLLTVKYDKRSLNALGVAYHMSGDLNTAADYFKRAAANGNAEAERNLKQMEAISKAQKDNE